MKDPTQTTGIRKAWTRQVSRRSRTLRGRVNTLFTQGRVPFDETFIEFFEAWMLAEAGKLFGGDWQDKYLDEAYEQGLESSGFDTLLDITHQRALLSLHKRARSDLDAALRVMVSQSVEKVSSGILARDSKAKIAGEIKDRVSKIGETRAKLIANTLTPYSHNVAGVKAAESSGEDIKYLWITRQDEKVRTTHALRNRKLYSRKAAMNLIGEPNCRCRIKPVIADERQAKKYREIRREGLAISTEAQRERRFFATLRRAQRAEGFDG